MGMEGGVPVESCLSQESAESPKANMTKSPQCVCGLTRFSRPKITPKLYFQPVNSLYLDFKTEI